MLDTLSFRDTLQMEAEEEIMACIGCNDCMLACPLPETRIVTIAELNAAVSQSVISNQNVIDFVTACTQCRQCVPVCPADLRRADMVLFNKLKVEDQLPDQPLSLQVGTEIRPSGWTLDTLAQHLTQVSLFNNVDQADLRRTVLKSTLRQLAVGEVLCREGEFHERLYIVLEGAVEQTTANDIDPTQSVQILVLGPGSFHGETAVMANQPEQFTVMALRPSLVLEIPKVALYQLMQLSDVFNATMHNIYQERAIWTHARQSPVLGALPEPAVRKLLDAAQLVMLMAGETVYREGDEPENMYLVRSGFLRVSRRFGQGRDRVLVYFREGDAFGAVPLLIGGRNSITVQANTRSELIQIPGQALNDILTEYPHVRGDLLKQALAAEEVTRSPQLAPQTPAQGGAVAHTTQMNLSWTALIDKGVLQGHEVLVIDQTLCTDCNNCVDSCGRRHGYSRLERQGLQLGNLLFPTACRHCEDPVCLLCSVNGITRLPNGEITIVSDNCIGCGACAERCPYGNIRMHDIEQKPKKNLLFDLLDLLRGDSARQIALNQLSIEKAQVAVKCDLCAGYDDYACVTACPVGAAFRINPVQAFGRDDY